MREKFWALIIALTMINFGLDFVIGGAVHASVYHFFVWGGSWFLASGIAILVWLVTNKNGGKIGKGV